MVCVALTLLKLSRLFSQAIPEPLISLARVLLVCFDQCIEYMHEVDLPKQTPTPELLLSRNSLNPFQTFYKRFRRGISAEHYVIASSSFPEIRRRNIQTAFFPLSVFASRLS
jgi:hypothetical protein